MLLTVSYPTQNDAVHHLHTLHMQNDAIQYFNVEAGEPGNEARDELCVGGARTLVLAVTSELTDRSWVKIYTPVFKTVRQLCHSFSVRQTQ